MPRNKDFKRLVRQRVAATGEPYTAARAALAGPQPGRRPPTATVMPERWLELLAERDHALGAFELLRGLPPDDLRPLAVRAARHDDWRVRRHGCRLLDDLAITEASLAALTACLDDPHPKVRRAALHSLSCERCKPDGCVLDVRPLFERMAGDPNAKVRSTVIGTLSWRDDSDWARNLLARAAEHDRSAEVRGLARRGLARLERQARTDAARRTLPDDLRRKTERHPAKWVAIADGRIIGVNAFEGGLRRVIKGTARDGEAAVYWVAPATAG